MATEKLSYEIAAIYSASPEVKRAIDDFAKINTTGAKVRQQLNSMTTVSAKTGEQFRKTRVNTAQLGIQINQLGTQIASGTNVGMAFTQQIGDIGYALSNAGGKLGMFGRLLSGPVGFALGGLVMALGPAISDMLGFGDAAEKAERAGRSHEDALLDLSSSYDEVRNALKEYNDEMDRNRITEEEAIKRRITLAARNLQVAMTTYEKAMATLTDIRAMRSDPSFMAGPLIASGAAAAVENAALESIQQSMDDLREAQEALANSAAELSELQLSSAEASNTRTSAISAEAAAQSRLNDIAKQYLSVLPDARLETQAAMLQQFLYLQGQSKIALMDETELFLMRAQAASDAARAQREFNESLSARLSEQIEQREDFALPDSVVKGVENNLTIIRDNMRGYTDEMKSSFEAVGMSISNAFQGMLTGAMSWKDGMKSVIQSVIAELWKLYVVQQIVGVVKGFLGDIGLPVPTEARAVGGYVQQGTPYMVGERGPEMFIPGASGTIIPNHNMGRSGGGTNVTVNVDARGATDPAMVREQAQRAVLEAAPAIISASQQGTMTTLGRPRLGGVIR